LGPAVRVAGQPAAGCHVLHPSGPGPGPADCARPGQLVPAAAPPGERALTEPAAGLAGPTGQASDPQRGPHTGQIGELSPSGGPSQRGQHCQARWEGGHHRPGPQPQQAQAQAHQRQHRHAGTATRRRDAAPTWFTTGAPSGGAHAKTESPAILGPLPGLTPPGGPGPAGLWAAAPARRRAPGDENRDRAKQRAHSS